MFHKTFIFYPYDHKCINRKCFRTLQVFQWDIYMLLRKESNKVTDHIVDWKTKAPQLRSGRDLGLVEFGITWEDRNLNPPKFSKMLEPAYLWPYLYVVIWWEKLFTERLFLKASSHYSIFSRVAKALVPGAVCAAGAGLWEAQLLLSHSGGAEPHRRHSLPAEGPLQGPGHRPGVRPECRRAAALLPLALPAGRDGELPPRLRRRPSGRRGPGHGTE